MKLAIVCCVAAGCIAAGAAAAQAPVVEKVDPPDWWAAHSINPVRLLIRGRNLSGARLQCARVTCSNVRVNSAGTYVFADVTIPRGLAAGAYPLTLRTAAGSAPVPFAVARPLARAGRFQGFGPDDVIYLLMPDRFANGDTANDEPAVSRGLIDRTKGRRWHGGDLGSAAVGQDVRSAAGASASATEPIQHRHDACQQHRPLW